MAYGEKEIVLKKIEEAIDKIEYGSVVITIHDGKVTQIDQTEKWRFSNTKKKITAN